MRISDWGSDVCSSDLIVADDQPVEAPFAAQHVAEQPAVRVARHPVDLVIARHHRADRGAADDLAEGRAEILAQLALRERRAGDIVDALRLAVAGHMLERRENLDLAAPLEPARALPSLASAHTPLGDATSEQRRVGKAGARTFST